MTQNQDQPNQTNEPENENTGHTEGTEEGTSQASSRGRPLPEYGEYAPEGWHPPATMGITTPGADDSGSASGPEPSREPSSEPPATPVPSGPQVPGVPHNLGVRSGGRPVSGTQSSPSAQQPTQHGAQTPGTQTQAPQGQTPQAQAPRQERTAQAPGAGPSGGRIADRVVTILLLVLGGYAALSFSLSFLTLGTQLFMIADAVGLEDFRVPEAVNTIGMVGVFAMLSLYAVNLIWSIQRLRAGKLAFWVPLAAGVLSFILLMIITAIAMAQTPELLESVNPENLDQIVRSLNE